MTATRRLVLDLPEETVAAIEARVASGEYPDTAAAVTAAVAAQVGPDSDDDFDIDEDSPEWAAIIAECDEAERRIDAGLERTYRVDEVFDELRTRLRAKAAGRRSA